MQSGCWAARHWREMIIFKNGPHSGRKNFFFRPSTCRKDAGKECTRTTNMKILGMYIPHHLSENILFPSRNSILLFFFKDGCAGLNGNQLERPALSLFFSSPVFTHIYCITLADPAVCTVSLSLLHGSDVIILQSSQSILDCLEMCRVLSRHSNPASTESNSQNSSQKSCCAGSYMHLSTALGSGSHNQTTKHEANRRTSFFFCFCFCFLFLPSQTYRGALPFFRQSLFGLERVKLWPSAQQRQYILLNLIFLPPYYSSTIQLYYVCRVGGWWCCLVVVVWKKKTKERGEVGWSNVSRHKLIRTVILLFSNPRHVDTPALWPSPNPHSPSSSSTHTYPFFCFVFWLAAICWRTSPTAINRIVLLSDILYAAGRQQKIKKRREKNCTCILDISIGRAFFFCSCAAALI